MGAGESGSASLSCGEETERREMKRCLKEAEMKTQSRKHEGETTREKTESEWTAGKREREAERQVRGRKQEDAPGLRSQIKRESRERASGRESLFISV